VLDDRSQPWSQEIKHRERISKLEVRHLGQVRGLAGGVGLIGMKELILSTHGTVTDEEVARVVYSPDWQRLRVLHLYSPLLGPATVRAVVQSPWLGRLRDLSLHGALTPACLEMLASWPGLSRLDRLDLDGGWMPAALRALLHSPHLSPLTHFTAARLPLPDFRQAFRERLGRRFHG
jgi:hypothetical protein